MAKRQRAGVAIVALCVRGAPARNPSDYPKRLKLPRRALLALAEATDWPAADAIVLSAGYFRIERHLGDQPNAQRLRHLAEETVIKGAIECCSVLTGNPRERW
jgi:hypothetical protein